MKTKILIIEDDASLIYNISSLLEEEGYQVVQANNGFIGIEKARNEKPDLIICDIMMPGLDGYQVKEELNKNNSTFDIPLLFLSARTDLIDFRKGMQLGADDYMFKPYIAANLLEVIELRIKKKNRIVAKLIEQNTTKGNNKNQLDNNDSIILKLGNKSNFVKISAIKFIQATSQYSNIYLSNGKCILVRKSLNYWESVLPTCTFNRIHRSTIININYLTKIERTLNNTHNVYLEGNSEPFILSRRYSAKFKNKLK